MAKLLGGRKGVRTRLWEHRSLVAVVVLAVAANQWNTVTKTEHDVAELGA